MSRITPPLELPVPRNATALMQQLQLLVGKNKHRFWCGGVIDSHKLPAFVEKMASRYPITRNKRQRDYDMQRGRAVTHFIAFASDGKVHWWLLSRPGAGGLADPSSPDARVARDAMSADGHITFGDYVLMYATKTVLHKVDDKKTGKPKTILSDSSTWTWKMRSQVVREIRASITQCCKHIEYGAEGNDIRPGWGLRGLLWATRQRPQFAGVRNETIELHREALDSWAPQQTLWRSRHPDLVARFGERAGALLSMKELREVLPKFGRIVVYGPGSQVLRDLGADEGLRGH
ncbi:hypothetical protein SAMN05421548_12944 [Paraburkholderia lycopersici]|uniref:Uncharacterized protein n=2 Tax=Paraburkholderia lycopersici TaxID=416944 RepID=A0A1G6Z151_9BURK|nr:hypothetical protein SAMN05421548_12944 [Paraburkholderia lycopersici]